MSTPAASAVSDFEGGKLFLATTIDVVAIGRNGLLWRSRRASLDGITALTYAGGYVQGVGNEPGGLGVNFSVDALTGETSGGFEFDPTGPGHRFIP